MLEPPATTTGGLVRDENGRPIAGASVRILGSCENPDTKDFADFDLKVKTDTQGRWTCSELPKSWTWINVLASHPDYIDTLVDGHFDSPTTEQLRGQSVVTMLSRGVPIQGRVVDERGEPLAAARVGLGADRRIGQRFHPSTTTDADGRFKFGAVVPAGVQIMTAQAAGHAPLLKQITVAGPAPVTVEFRLGSAQSFRGQVVDPRGKPLLAQPCRRSTGAAIHRSTGKPRPMPRADSSGVMPRATLCHTTSSNRVSCRSASGGSNPPRKSTRSRSTHPFGYTARWSTRRPESPSKASP